MVTAVVEGWTRRYQLGWQLHDHSFQRTSDQGSVDSLLSRLDGSMLINVVGSLISAVDGSLDLLASKVKTFGKRARILSFLFWCSLLILI